MPPGRLIAFEGGEASGKSTHAARFAERLQAHLTREPGGTPLGETLRDVVLHRPEPDFDPRAETLVMLAARAQHVSSVIGPLLEQGRTVVTDRFSHSTLAYQGYGRGLDLEELRRLCSWAAGGRWPDLVVLLDVPYEEARSRLAGSGPDRIEDAGEAFHRRVLDGFRSLAAEEAERWLVVDGTPSPAEVAERIWEGYRRWSDPVGRAAGAGPGPVGGEER